MTAALHHIYTEYPDTVGQVQVLEGREWRGTPALRAADLAPSAVAYLGAGLWLHHSLDIPEEEPARDVLTLIAPVPAGRGTWSSSSKATRTCHHPHRAEP